MMKKIASILAATLLVAGCGRNAPEPEPAPIDYNAEAQRIARDSIIIDTHVDVPYRLEAVPQDVYKPLTVAISTTPARSAAA